MAKTISQVKQYFKSKDWYKEFAKNIRKYHKLTVNQYFDEIVDHDYSLALISAFLWTDSPQGFIFWNEKDIEYIKWYENESTH